MNTAKHAAISAAAHVALYCRISRDRNGRAEGVDVQERQGREYAAQAWPQMPVVAYSDNDLTAADEDVWRPGFEKLREAIRAGDVAHVWCVEQSRLQRLEVGWFVLAAELDAAGIGEVHTNRDGIVRVRDEIAGIKAVLAAGEVRKLTKRINDRLDDNAAQGVAPGSRPFGYRHGQAVDGSKTYVIVPEEADAIRSAAGKVLAGWSLSSVAASLREQGLTGAHQVKVRDALGNVVTDDTGQPVTQPGTIRAQTVRSWLTKPTIAGLRVHRGEIVGRGNWPAILAEDVWQACRARLSAPRTVQREDGGSYSVTSQGGFTGRRYMLTGGLAVCGVCGAPMVGQVLQLKGGSEEACAKAGRPYRGGRNVPYLICTRPRDKKAGRKGACTCIMLEATEQHVLGRLWAELDKPAFLDAITADDHAARREQITNELSAIDGRRAELAAMWGTGALASGEWTAARDALKANEQGLRAELAEKAPPAARMTIEHARQAWPLMTLDERREFIRMFIEIVTISPAPPGLSRFDAGRVAVGWRKR